MKEGGTFGVEEFLLRLISYCGEVGKEESILRIILKILGSLLLPDVTLRNMNRKL